MFPCCLTSVNVRAYKSGGFVRIPRDAVIADDKITRYLLVQKPRNDKSKFLAQAGFIQENPAALRAAIQLLAESVEVVKDRSNKYGTFSKPQEN